MRTSLLTLTLLASICASAQTLQQTLFFDFGSDVLGRGELTSTDADANNNYWNNIKANNDNYIAQGSEFAGIVNSSNQATDCAIIFNSRFTTNGLSGGGGLILESGDTRLGDLAILTAVEDYMFIESNENNSSFTISGLNPEWAYSFSIFASRKATETRTGIYTAVGYNTAKGTLTAAGSAIGTLCDGVTTINQNTTNILKLSSVFPDADGNITFTVSRSIGSYIPINALKVEAFSGVEKPALFTYKKVTLKGSAVEGGEVEMHNVIENKRPTDKYEAFVKLSEGTYNFSAIDANDNIITLGVGDADKYAENGSSFEQSGESVVRITLDPSDNSISVLNITGLYVSGPLSEAGWSTNGEEIAYKANGVWEREIEFTKEGSVSDPSRIVLLINRSWDYQLKSVAGGHLQIGLQPQGYTLNDIRLKKGRYIISVDLRNYTYLITPTAGIDPNSITVIGSSVANGQGADSNEGYAYMLGSLLSDRYDNNLSDNNFYTSGVAVNSNNSINVLNRFDDLINNHGSFAILGLGLGNEGIHNAANPDAIYAQWKTNILQLVSQINAEGKPAVVTNNYPRGDYNATDYAYVRQMNLEMQQWDVPTVNFLGALDNCKGNGQWADGYQVDGDVYHPNTAGHLELMHAFVPSLFDAIKAGKEQPMRTFVSHGTTLTSQSVLTLEPEDQVHAFTFAINVRADVACTPITFHFADGSAHSLSISVAQADGAWHQYAISYYYAAGRIFTYIDGVAIADEEVSQLELSHIEVGGNDIEVSEMFFYRSGMNNDEIIALNEGKMLKSSLEIYAPLINGSLENLAQSLNQPSLSSTLTRVKQISNKANISITDSYNIMGQRITNNHRGLVISNRRLSLQR